MTSPTLVESFSRLPPLILSYAELESVVLPIVGGDAWALDTIGDLWRKGAPHPTKPFHRIVFPGALAEWLADVLTRQGRPLDVAARAFVELQKLT